LSRSWYVARNLLSVDPVILKIVLLGPKLSEKENAISQETAAHCDGTRRFEEAMFTPPESQHFVH
jgi:hypothetical protein